MKKTIIYTLIGCFIALAACKKGDVKTPDFVRVPVPSVNLVVAESDTKFDLVRPDTFHAKYTVGLFFESDIKPKKFDVVVVKNGVAANVKTLKADVTTFPSSFDVTGAELITLFGAPIVAGDKFQISVNITTQDDQVYLAFPPANAKGWGTNIDVASGGGNTVITIAAPCIFHIEDYVGDYTVLVDDWADYAAGDDIAVSTIGRDTLAFKFKTTPALPIYIKVDTLANKTSVAFQTYGGYPAFGIPEINVESVDSKDNFVDPCVVQVSVRLHHSAGTDNYGDNTIVLQKK